MLKSPGVLYVTIVKVSWSRPSLETSALLNCRAALSPEMARRIEKGFGPKMDTLLPMQTAYEVPRYARGLQKSRSSALWHDCSRTISR